MVIVAWIVEFFPNTTNILTGFSCNRTGFHVRNWQTLWWCNFPSRRKPPRIKSGSRHRHRRRRFQCTTSGREYTWTTGLSATGVVPEQKRLGAPRRSGHRGNRNSDILGTTSCATRLVVFRFRFRYFVVYAVVVVRRSTHSDYLLSSRRRRRNLLRGQGPTQRLFSFSVLLRFTIAHENKNNFIINDQLDGSRYLFIYLVLSGRNRMVVTIHNA